MNGTQSLSRINGGKFMHGKRGPFSDSSLILLGILGFDGKLNFVNPAWGRILGHPPEELLHRSLSDLMQHERSVAVALVDQLLAEDSLDQLEFGLRCEDGTCKWFLWHRRFDSQNQAIFIAGYDITEQKTREIASVLRSYEQSRNGNLAGDGP